MPRGILVLRTQARKKNPLATFYDRFCFTNDYLTDGYGLDSSVFQNILTLYTWGKATASEVKSYFGCTGTGQQNDVQAILDTLPTSLLLTVGAVNRATWADRVQAAVWAVQSGNAPTISNEAEFKTALGV